MSWQQCSEYLEVVHHNNPQHLGKSHFEAVAPGQPLCKVVVVRKSKCLSASLARELCDLFQSFMWGVLSFESSTGALNLTFIYISAHVPGLVTLQVACEGYVISNSCVFEYKSQQVTVKAEQQQEWFGLQGECWRCRLPSAMETLKHHQSRVSNGNTSFC